MSKNSIDAYGAEGKTNLLSFDPDKLKLVEDSSHALYDPRVHDPVDASLVASIKMKGVITPIIIWKDPETGDVCVVEGRGRVKAAREANRQLREAGEVPKEVPAVIGKGNAKSVMALMVLANEGRKEPTPLGRGEMALRLIDAGYSEDQVAVILCCGKAVLDNYLALAGSTEALKTAVRDGKVNATLAYTLAAKKPDEQRAALAKLLEVAASAKGQNRSKQMNAAAGKKTLRGRREIEQFRHDTLPTLDATSQAVAEAVLAWVLGGDFKVAAPKSGKKVA
jgi:ParB family transcriptional regulator, chromosome partitioning protein